MLARRELSEAQVRQRLTRRQHPSDAIEAAIARLKASGSLDDARVAAAIARTQTSVHGRGKRRVLRQIETAGISRTLAAQAASDVFDEIDPDALLQAALDRRLRGGTAIADDRTFQRLYRYLVTQGFDADRVLAALRARRP